MHNSNILLSYRTEKQMKKKKKHTMELSIDLKFKVRTIGPNHYIVLAIYSCKNDREKKRNCDICFL